MNKPALLFIYDWRVQMKIGALDWEKHDAQEISIDIEIETDIFVPAKTDKLEDCLEYVSLTSQIRSRLQKGHVCLLEKVAEIIVEEVLTHPLAQAVTVKVRKHRVLTPTTYTGVKVYRIR